MDTRRYLACITCNQTVGGRIERDLTATLAGMGVVATGLSFPALTEGYQWKLHQFALDDADFCIFLVGQEYGPLSATGVGFLHLAEPDLQSMYPEAHGFVEFRLDTDVFDRIKQYFSSKGWLFQARGIWQLSALGEAEWLELSDSS